MQKISGAVIADLKTQEEYCPPPSVPGDVVPEKTLNLNFDFPDPDKLLDSAVNSLARCLRAKGFELAASGWPIRIFRKENYSTEEFELASIIYKNSSFFLLMSSSSTFLAPMS